MKDCLGEISRREREKKMEVYCIYTYKDSIMKLTEHCLKGEESEGEWEYNIEGVNLFKVHCTLVWNYHKEIPSY
jgi:hypothetical protein